MPNETIIKSFDNAAMRYDEVATMQARVAQYLTEWATPDATPTDILDIGAGTGFVAAAAKKRWPHAAITALDSSSQMLGLIQRKMPDVKIVAGDACKIDLDQRYDVIFCSMLLHWLPDPRKALQRWRHWLKPEGRLYATLLVEGSFEEWRRLGAAEGMKSGLWVMPYADFAEGMAMRTEQITLSVKYPSAKEFLRSLKIIGASVPQPGHEAWNIAAMRRVLARAPSPFTVSHQVLYIELPSSPNS